MAQDSTERFTDGRSYAAARPAYPADLIGLIRDRICAVPEMSNELVIDVGAGTGIFTAQLAAALRESISIVGVEPSESMRSAATTSDQVAFVNGRAEKLPFDDGVARAITAATSAHWFDRAAFYREATRVLVPGGVIAIIEYVRDETSPAAAAVEAFLARHGERKAYSRPDYAVEIEAAGFTTLVTSFEIVTLSLSPNEFVELALSSSHAAAAIQATGRAGAEALLREKSDELLTDGRISFGYRFNLVTATRAIG